VHDVLTCDAAAFEEHSGYLEVSASLIHDTIHSEGQSSPDSISRRHFTLLCSFEKTLSTRRLPSKLVWVERPLPTVATSAGTDDIFGPVRATSAQGDVVIDGMFPAGDIERAPET
jgi:hypothetical protein